MHDWLARATHHTSLSTNPPKKIPNDRSWYDRRLRALLPIDGSAGHTDTAGYILYIVSPGPAVRGRRQARHEHDVRICRSRGLAQDLTLNCTILLHKKPKRELEAYVFIVCLLHLHLHWLPDLTQLREGRDLHAWSRPCDPSWTCCMHMHAHVKSTKASKRDR